ncbi:S-adenosyl-L-methionine-dependent methyltransferase [Imleria badia]|nr:S-adenosyl-L-methionine-dependent methyltransferase [Imleria badia]
MSAPTVTRPSRRGKRPSALDISFRDDTDDSATTSDASRKRDRGDAGDADLRGAKRRNLDTVPRPIRKYEPRPYEVPETKDLLVFGEEQDPPDDDRKRTRLLSHFAFFDAANENTMISLDALDDDVRGNHHVLGAGFIVARYDIDEDEGQEDGLDEEAERQYIRMSRILRYYTRYWVPNSPFFVETDHAIYELDVLNPSKKYRSQFRPFWRLQTILRFVISSASIDANQEFFAFSREYSRLEVFGQPLTEGELWAAVPKLRETLETVPRADALRESVVIQHLSRTMAPVILRPVGRRNENEQRSSTRDLHIDYKGNLDTAVLRDQVVTHVTMRISQMALPLFREKIRVVAPQPRRQAEPEIPKDDLALRLQGFLIRTQTRRLPQFRPNQRIGRSRWLKHILIDGVKYEVGDIVLFYPGKDIPPNPNDLPPTDTLADHFWFARIIHMNEEHETVHVQWFEHSSKTILQELGHSQELFLINQCDTQALTLIIGKVNAHYIKPDESIAGVKPHDYFYRYLWNDYEGTFTNIEMDALNASAQEPPPDNCPACEIARQFDHDMGPAKIHLGFRWHGVDYHLDDCVLIKAEEGPCHIGHIIEFIHDRGHDNVKVKVQLFGRTDKLGCRPDATLKDERHLFHTNDKMTIGIDELIGVCYVVVKGDMPNQDAWLAMSPYHFYVKYHFSSLMEMDWDRRRRMRWHDLPVCRMCMKQDLKKMNGMKAFLETEEPLRVFDPFGGTGAFALAMEEVGCFKLTHAVEISPSAAKTLRKNASPDTKVYNQCSNRILYHAILTHANKNPEEPLKSIEGHPLPPLPKPGDIDCLIAGFPCQPHSTLNMYQRANDMKSNLILTALSFVDFLRPSYCIFENVRGFLQYNLRTHQDGKYSVKGGIPMGGLKLVTAALLDMGYQFRCALLQAAHYGTPQSRVRFFLIAAKRDLDLPPFPQPTHDFPVTDALEIRFPEELTLRPISTFPGVAPHRYVSVHDAISDLPRFDWKDPTKVLSRRQMEENRIIECREDKSWCGYQGPDVPYEHDPRTTFQKKCRSRPTRNIQQYTRTYEPKKVERQVLQAWTLVHTTESFLHELRIIKIPIEPGADYRNLPSELWEWQFVNPASATGKTGYRAGFYGRVERDGWFRTTVTNVDPTAKQSRVIHPYSKRILTVRELARSQGFPDHFTFHVYTRKDHVVTMHRQIGNAVPWPVSVAIAREFRETFYKDWVKRNPVDEPTDEEFTDTDDDAMDVD